MSESESTVKLPSDIDYSPTKEFLQEKVPDVANDITDESPPTPFSAPAMDTATPGAVTSYCIDNHTPILCFLLLVLVAMFTSLFVETSLFCMVASVAPASIVMFYFLGA